MTTYGYARVSTDGQSVAALVKELRDRRSREDFPRDGERSQERPRAARRALDELAADDVLLVTRLDRLARSTRDLLNILAAIAAKGGRFRSLRDTWADKQ